MILLLGRRKQDSLFLVAFMLASLVLSIYAITALRSFKDTYDDADTVEKIKIQILIAKRDSMQGCSMDTKGGLPQ